MIDVNKTFSPTSKLAEDNTHPNDVGKDDLHTYTLFIANPLPLVNSLLFCENVGYGAHIGG